MTCGSCSKAVKTEVFLIEIFFSSFLLSWASISTYQNSRRTMKIKWLQFSHLKTMHSLFSEMPLNLNEKKSRNKSNKFNSCVNLVSHRINKEAFIISTTWILREAANLTINLNNNSRELKLTMRSMVVSNSGYLNDQMISASVPSIQTKTWCSQLQKSSTFNWFSICFTWTVCILKKKNRSIWINKDYHRQMDSLQTDNSALQQMKASNLKCHLHIKRSNSHRITAVVCGSRLLFPMKNSKDLATAFNMLIS